MKTPLKVCVVGRILEAFSSNCVEPHGDVIASDSVDVVQLARLAKHMGVETRLFGVTKTRQESESRGEPIFNLKLEDSLFSDSASLTEALANRSENVFNYQLSQHIPVGNSRQTSNLLVWLETCVSECDAVVFCSQGLESFRQDFTNLIREMCTNHDTLFSLVSDADDLEGCGGEDLLLVYERWGCPLQDMRDSALPLVKSSELYMANWLGSMMLALKPHQLILLSRISTVVYCADKSSIYTVSTNGYQQSKNYNLNILVCCYLFASLFGETVAVGTQMLGMMNGVPHKDRQHCDYNVRAFLERSMVELIRKHADFKQCCKIRNEARKEGRRVVATCGCFDILHSGHIEYLQYAKRCGDLLVVGLNSDSSVRQLKGQKRPINSERKRFLALAILDSVDYICIFGDLNSAAFIENIQPDIFIKGGDYGADMLNQLEKEAVSRFGGAIVCAPLVACASTSETIDVYARSARW